MGIALKSRLRPILGVKEWVAASKFWKKAIPEYEDRFANNFECRYGTMFSYGRTALYALLKVWELKEAEIICPAYTCVVVPHAITLSGNTPIFVDCAEGSFNMSYDGIENSITAKTRAIIVTHLFGYPMNVQKIEQIKRRAEEKYGQKIYVVQDAAHSYGAKWNGELVTKFGDAAIFGCNISKVITSIFGGMVTTNDCSTNLKLQEFRASNCIKDHFKSIKRFLYLNSVYIAFMPIVYGMVNWMERKGLLNPFVKYYEDDRIYFPSDWNTLPCDVEARVGLVQLRMYEEIVNRRVSNSRHWINKLQDEKILFIADDYGCTYSHCVGIVDSRDGWAINYRKKGIQLGILIEYCIPFMQSYYKSEYERRFNVAKYYSNHTVNFPNYYI